jgi:DNA-binding transcriptional ArsR family regulator
MPPKEPAIDQRIMKALSHPLRVRMLTLLYQKVASPSELADELDEPLGNVSYHMRFLADLDMVKLVRTEPRRGAVEHYYEALEPPLISDDDWAQLPVALRRSLSDSALTDIARELRGAAKTGGFDRENIHVSRLSLMLDQEAWDELSALLSDVMDRARAIQEQSNRRRKGSEPAGIPTAVVLMQFESGTASVAGTGAVGAAKRARRA